MMQVRHRIASLVGLRGADPHLYFWDPDVQQVTKVHSFRLESLLVAL